MSHVDEGALHAYLDGALDEFPAAEAARIREHLDGCAECAERLEQERRVRSDAHAMLGLAAPDVEMPSLEELRAYVKRTRPEGTAPTTRIHRLGWAASVVLAIGAGWMLRGGQVPDAQVSRGAATEASAPVASTAALADRPAEANAAASGAASVAVPDQSAVASAEARQDIATAAAETFERAELPADVLAKVRNVDGADVANPAPTRLADEQLTATDPTALPAVEEEPEVVLSSEPLALEAVVVTSSFADRAVALDSPVVLVPALDAVANVAMGAMPDSGRVGELQEAERERRAERSRPDAATPVVSSMGVAAGSARRIFTDDELELDGASLASVPGFEVLSVTGIAEGTTFLGGRALQRFDADRTFEIFTLEPDVEPTVLPGLAPGEREVAAEFESGWVVLRGALTEAELDLLLDRLAGDG